MKELATTQLWFDPGQEFHEARIVLLTDKLMREQTDSTWWTEDWIDQSRAEDEIDRYWNWRNCAADFDDKPVEVLKVGVVTSDGLVQGGIVISRDPVTSVLDAGKSALWVEWLLTAPRNRPFLRNDGESGAESQLRGFRWYTGVGTELLKWGAAFSKLTGYDGRIRLEASPGFVEWYEQRHFRRLPRLPVFYEGVAYTPMEIPATMVDKLLVPRPH